MSALLLLAALLQFHSPRRVTTLRCLQVAKQQALASGGVNEALAVLLSVSSGQVNSLQLAGGGGGGEGLGTGEAPGPGAA